MTCRAPLFWGHMTARAGRLARQCGVVCVTAFVPRTSHFTVKSAEERDRSQTPPPAWKEERGLPTGEQKSHITKHCGDSWVGGCCECPRPSGRAGGAWVERSLFTCGVCMNARVCVRGYVVSCGLDGTGGCLLTGDW